ncbi:hypothetical protein PspLS_09593 [Pyricularia sp. CBS 133598]|nr:hypothetical protein PspLS_09593 [Pyricularia sp. CBS 133598]
MSPDHLFSSTGYPEPIAIVGIGCRFPGCANSPSKLWEILRSPLDLARRIPKQRWNLDKFYHPIGTHHGTTNVTASYFLDDSDDIRYFDTKFFGVGTAEAEAMDPQHRMLLEVVYEAMEQGGFTLSSLHGSDTAVYVGMMCTDYNITLGLDSTFIPQYTATGVSPSNASSRISYYFNWHGPSVTIDTACSSSLVAVHQAVDHLRTGRSRVATACGTNLMINVSPYLTESKLNMLSPTGRSRMWDADADGYARGDGIAAVMLKRLSDAIADGDVIEGVIRNTGFTHDGRTLGITMPSGQAQSDLIRRTYAEAGLNLTNRANWPQFFEAHGTGTPVGDPQEASALASAFYPGSDDKYAADDKLLVGSIKTLVGHTEGTAGLAGLLKACLALQHAEIPPNLLFDRLSPGVVPYYKHLCIPTQLQSWPEVPKGQPRRASVNSFGFGGTDAHAILESYESPLVGPAKRPSPAVLPFTFSAASEGALRGLLGKYESFLKENEDVSLGDLGYSLACRRSALPYKVAMVASTPSDLAAKIHNLVQNDEQNTDEAATLAPRTSSESSTSYLGVFTGQGAQWARMGLELVNASPSANSLLARLQESLDTLPNPEHRPVWTLLDELSATEDESKVATAEISQPLCTAVQIILVELLRLAGVRFEAVVGHSSGEIGAAYAAGFLSSADAIRVAYYRGYWTTRKSYGGEKGAMLAVATSFDDALELCQSEDLESRIAVAAVNSASSVTLSGDESAVLLAKSIFDEEEKFNRLLRVDKAYHSHHMLACAQEYEQSLTACGIKFLTPTGGDGAVSWYSSVDEGEVVTTSAKFNASYWVQNMTSPVLFQHALKAALTAHRGVDMVVEVGPHPALKGPATDVIQTLNDVPYFGTLQRGMHDVEALSGLLGNIWTLRGPDSLRLKPYQDSFAGDRARFISNLPTYSWDHDRPLWWEARSTRNYLRQEDKFHDLLGSKTPDGSAEEMKWVNWLKADEISWLSGHSLQGQLVFPGAGYLVMAIEASMRLAGDYSVQLIEFNDIDIRKALALPNSGMETVVALSGIRWELSNKTFATEPTKGRIFARFTCSTPPSKEAGELLVNCCCEVVITLGPHNPNILAPRGQAPVALAEVEVADFYAAMTKMGYYYEGPFKSITSLQRKLDVSSGRVSVPVYEKDTTEALLIHPGMLDSVLQALFAAYSAPGDNRLWSMHAPRTIQRIRIVPSLCRDNASGELAFDTVLTDATQRNRMVGDVDLYTAGFGQKLLEIEGLAFVPLSKFGPANDRHVFAKYAWVPDAPCGKRALAETTGFEVTAEGLEKATALERISFFYLRSIRETLHAECANKSRASPLPPHRLALMRWTDHVYELVESGQHPYIPVAWLEDSQSIIDNVSSLIADDADVKLGVTVGQNLPDVIRKDENILAYMMENDLLDRYYEQGLGLADLNRWSANLAQQIAQKHPQMSIIEIGAGTGGTTKGIVSALAEAFASYTYTDVSTSFFEKARENLAAWEDRFEYKPLNIEADPSTQGFAVEAFDLAVAGNVLHATRDLGETLKNTRSLLKPGGFLMAVECVDNTAIRAGFVQGGLEGWWVGAEAGRPWGPTITLEEWDVLLKASGFAGVETATPVLNGLYNQASVWLARAVDDDFRILREPLGASASSSTPYTVSNLILLGTEAGSHAKALAEGAHQLLRDAGIQCVNVMVQNVLDVTSLESLMGENGSEGTNLPKDCTVISLVELDAPIFKRMTERRWEALKRALVQCSSLLWLTAGARNGIEPYAAMTAGVVRTLVNEMGINSFQMLDVDQAADLSPKLVVDTVLRLKIQHEWKSKGPRQDMTLTMEPEYALEDGALMILRVLPDPAKNDRYNSLHRRITKSIELPVTGVATTKEPIVVALWNDAETCWNLKEGPRSGLQSDLDTFADAGFQPEDLITIEVDYCLLSSLHTPAGRLNLIVGKNITGTKVQYVCVAPRHASTIVIPRSCAVPTSGDSIIQPFMSYAAGFFICQRLFEFVPPTGSVILHCPDSVFAGIFAKLAAVRNITVRFTSADPKKAAKRNWVYLHPLSPSRAIVGAIPEQLDVFVDMSGYGTLVDSEDLTEHGPERILSNLLQENLPPATARYDMSIFLGAETETLRSFAKVMRSESQSSIIRERLQNANKLAMDLLYDIPDGMPLPMVPVSEISTVQESFTGKKDLRIISWVDQDSHSSRRIEVEVEPVDRRPGLFRGDETYWLVGLAGDMGRSLCDWMIEHGARYIVLSSRNPQLPSDWLDFHHIKGNIHIAGVAMDITSYSSTVQAKEHILHTLNFPKIAGVANGAMILRDKPMLETDMETLQQVLRPKVDGTLHLDRIFDDKHGLDWFIVLTSFASIIGNMGQMAYSAANSFQTALVRNRRSRGLPGAAIDINMVVGIGYVERERRSGVLDRHAADRLLNRSQLLPVSEPDLHQMFAEAVLACREASEVDDPEIITGLQHLTTEKAADTFWAMNPKFSHWIRNSHAGRAQGASAHQEARVPLKTRLAQVTRPAQAFGIIKDAMLSKLRLALSTEKLDPSMPLVDLGVDSLVAVLLRNWSIQETGVDVPVLKTLGGDSILDIAEFIVEKLDFEASSCDVIND